MTCDACGSDNIRVFPGVERFSYGSGVDSALLEAVVNVRECADCGMQTVAEGGEEARLEAIAKHLKIISPARVRSLRENRGISRGRLSRLTGVGEASLYRWEIGGDLPSPALGRFLLLLEDDAVYEKLVTVVDICKENLLDDEASRKDRFPNILRMSDAVRRQSSFSLV